jgi:hypothetical protein
MTRGFAEINRISKHVDSHLIGHNEGRTVMTGYMSIGGDEMPSEGMEDNLSSLSMLGNLFNGEGFKNMIGGMLGGLFGVDSSQITFAENFDEEMKRLQPTAPTIAPQKRLTTTTTDDDNQA